MLTYVGPQQKEFLVHKKPQFAAATFFEREFNSNFKEGQKDKIYLPDDHHGVFALFIE